MISVIIPTYNRIRLLPRAVQSVLNQTYADIELIIVDDGSTDGTKEWIKSIQDERVRYIYSDHQGACAARNRGTEAAKGEYVAFQDSDDIWYPEKLEKQLSFLIEKKADVVCSAFTYSGPNGENQCVWPDEKIADCLVTPKEIARRNLVSTQTILGKKSVFMAVTFDPEMPRLQDWECAMRLSKEYRVFYDSRVMAHVFEQPDSISRKPELAINAAHRFFEKHYEHTIPHNAGEFLKYWKIADNQLAIYCSEQKQIIENQRNELIQVYSDKGTLALENKQMHDELVQVYSDKGTLALENKQMHDELEQMYRHKEKIEKELAHASRSAEQLRNMNDQYQDELDLVRKKPIRWYINWVILKKK